MSVDLAGFRGLCHRAAAASGARVREFRVVREPTPSFHQGVLDYPTEAVAVACHRQLAWLAVIRPRSLDYPRASGPLTVLDRPELARALAAEPGWRLLSPTELAAPFTAADWPQCTAADVRYWRPATVGAALFNYWD